MARGKAFPHNHHSLNLLADELREVAERIEELASAYEKCGIDAPLMIDNQLSAEKGLLELRKLYFSGKSKLEKAISDKDFGDRRKRMNDAASQ